MIGFLSRFRTLIVTSLVSLLIGASVTFYIMNVFEDARRADAAEQAQVALREAVARTIKQSNEINRLNEETLTEYYHQQISIALTKVSTVEVEKYVPINDPVACNVPVGVVARVLNPARTGISASALPGATGALDAEARAASTITRVAEYQAHADVARENLSCIAQLNGLIDYLNGLKEWREKNTP